MLSTATWHVTASPSFWIYFRISFHLAALNALPRTSRCWNKFSMTKDSQKNKQPTVACFFKLSSVCRFFRQATDLFEVFASLTIFLPHESAGSASIAIRLVLFKSDFFELKKHAALHDSLVEPADERLESLAAFAFDFNHTYLPSLKVIRYLLYTIDLD